MQLIECFLHKKRDNEHALSPLNKKLRIIFLTIQVGCF